MKKFIYLFLLIGFAILVYLKSISIKAKWEKDIVTMEKLWELHGKPVEAVKAKYKKINFYKNISGVLKNKLLIKAMVPNKIKEKIRINQKFYILDKTTKTKDESGFVSYVSKDANVYTGLYDIELKLYEPVNSIKLNDIVLASVKVKTAANKIVLPISSVINEEKYSFCWVIQNKKAVKRKIVPGNLNKSLIEIDSGLKTGELVIVLGKENIKEGDLVKIINMNGDIQ